MSLTYSVEKSERKTISLTIERNNDIVIKAPVHATEEKIHNFFKRKQLWIYTKLEEKKYWLNSAIEKKEFADGEWFYYLGRIYKLILVDNVDFKLRFNKNRFELNRQYLDSGKEIFIEWYKQRFYERISSRVQFLAKKYHFQPTKISIKELKNRWGSCTQDNKLNFHWKIMLAPISVIEYIIIHELCHIKEKNHSAKFWDILSRNMPDYENYKEWLRKNGGDFVL